MAHDLDMTTGRAAMAYAKGTDTPWHGLGFTIDADAPVSEWQKAAGLDFTIEKAAVVGKTADGREISGAGLNRSILYRSDTLAPLSVMSTDGYHVVQPSEVLDFIGSSARAMGWKMETAGALRGGRKIWALANLGDETELAGGDRVKGYLLAATACDGTMASEFLFTSVRVVCQNTLHMAMDNGAGQHRVKVYHFTKLDPAAVKSQMGIAENAWSSFVNTAQELTRIKLSSAAAMKVLRKVYAPKPEQDGRIIEGEVLTDEQFLKANTTAARVLELFNGQAIGSNLASAKGTGWGMVNAATEFFDHRSKTFSQDNRLSNAWFGKGADVKQQFVDAVLELA